MNWIMMTAAILSPGIALLSGYSAWKIHWAVVVPIIPLILFGYLWSSVAVFVDRSAEDAFRGYAALRADPDVIGDFRPGFLSGRMLEGLQIVITLGILSVLAFPFGQWLGGSPFDETPHPTRPHVRQPLRGFLPALIERYNRALEHLTGKRTKLDNFHIDLSGFSPEVGDELGDMDYLNPGGCNRQIILLSTQQKGAPLLEMKFSTTQNIIRDFIDANEAQLFTLTARDAVAGELQNSVFSVPEPQRLLDIRSVTVEADTTTGIVRDAAKLDTLIARFRDEPDAWWDDVLVAQMIGLARSTGDVTRAPVTFKRPVSGRTISGQRITAGSTSFDRSAAPPYWPTCRSRPAGLTSMTLPIATGSQISCR